MKKRFKKCLDKQQDHSLQKVASTRLYAVKQLKTVSTQTSLVSKKLDFISEDMVKNTKKSLEKMEEFPSYKQDSEGSCDVLAEMRKQAKVIKEAEDKMQMYSQQVFWSMPPAVADFGLATLDAYFKLPNVGSVEGFTTFPKVGSENT